MPSPSRRDTDILKSGVTLQNHAGRMGRAAALRAGQRPAFWFSEVRVVVLYHSQKFGLVFVAGLARVQCFTGGIPKSCDSGYPKIRL